MPSMARLNLDVLGERLRRRRKHQQMTQQALAEVMQIPQSWISALENGKRPHVEADTVYRFSQALGCSIDYLLGITEEPAPTQKRPRPRKAARVG
jgi:transcriptional regulator with XRE-family HTH domain